MAVVEVNGAPVLSATLREPLQGAWDVDLWIDQGEAPAGPVVISMDDGARTLRGTVVRGGTFLEAARARVVGGAGGMSGAAPPRRYRGATVGIAARDLLTAGGEVLAPDSDTDVLVAGLPEWTAIGQTIGVALSTLLAAAAPGATWRMHDDGTVWIGRDTWPASPITEDEAPVDDDAPEDGSARYLLDAPALVVGTTLLGRRVALSHTELRQDGPIDLRVWFDAGSPVDRLRAALGAMVRSVVPGPDYRFAYWARVVAQSGGTVHLHPEDSRIPDMGDVQLALPPGETVDGVAGGRVLVAWAGDGRQAYAAGFDGSQTVPERVIAAVQAYLGGKAGAGPAARADALSSALTAFSNALGVYAGAIAAIADPSGTATSALATAITALQAAAPGYTATNARVK